MIGLKCIRAGREYRILLPITISLIFTREEFILEGGGDIHSRRRIKEGIEYEFTVADIDQPTERLSRNNDFSEVDPEYLKMVKDEQLQWEFKLQVFRKLEALLTAEGLI